MKLLKILLYLILVLIGLFLLAGLFAKKDYHIERSIDIKAPQSVVHEQVSKFKNIDNWSPWAKLDPNMVTKMEGTDGTVGCTQSWSGNDQVGKGQQTFTAITPDQVDTKVKFMEPWESEAPAIMKLSTANGITKATWSMDSKMPFPMNAFGMFMDMEKAIGNDYEKGLNSLKGICETIAAKPLYQGYEVKDEPAVARTFLGTRQVVPFADIPKVFASGMPKLFETLGKSGVNPTGPPSAIIWKYDEKAMKMDFALAAPVAADTKAPSGMQSHTMNGQRTLTINYYGAYEKTGAAHLAMDEYMAKNGLAHTYPVLEEYITDPMKEKDTSKWLTKVIYYANPK